MNPQISTRRLSRWSDHIKAERIVARELPAALGGPGVHVRSSSSQNRFPPRSTDVQDLSCGVGQCRHRTGNCIRRSIDGERGPEVWMKGPD